MENLHLIVGLGNPGAKYAQTRHNVGFQLVEQLAGQWKAAWTTEKKFQSKLARFERGGRSIILGEPQTFMNSSGEAISALAGYYHLPLKQLLVVVDDADLPLGEIRLRARGSSGGHHGLESIEQHLATREFARLRIGIGRADEVGREITDYVLTPFGGLELAVLERVLQAASRQVESWVDSGIEKAMTQFNGVVNGP